MWSGLTETFPWLTPAVKVDLVPIGRGAAGGFGESSEGHLGRQRAKHPAHLIDSFYAIGVFVILSRTIKFGEVAHDERERWIAEILADILNQLVEFCFIGVRFGFGHGIGFTLMPEDALDRCQRLPTRRGSSQR